MAVRRWIVLTTRRDVIRVTCLALTVGSIRAALGAERVYRLGILRPTSSTGSDAIVRDGLGRLGYVEGRDLAVERRDADTHPERLPALAVDLVRAKPDAIVAVGSSAVRAAIAATTTIPVVMFTNGDPVAAGFVRSLARPGGNVTGITFTPDGTLAGKKLQLLKEMVPGLRRVAFLSTQDPSSAAQSGEAIRTGSTIGLVVLPVAVIGGDYDRAFAEIARSQVQGLLTAATTYFARDRRQIIGLAARHRIPAIYEWREDVQAGGLMTYATSLPEMISRVAGYVDRIFKGARPSEMPIEQPTKFELVINLKTARSVGLTVPPALLLRADELIDEGG